MGFASRVCGSARRVGGVKATEGAAVKLGRRCLRLRSTALGLIRARLAGLSGMGDDLEITIGLNYRTELIYVA